MDERTFYARAIKDGEEWILGEVRDDFPGLYVSEADLQREAERNPDHILYFVKIIKTTDIFEEEYEPTRWWRVVDDDGVLLAETSDENEVRSIHAEYNGSCLERLFQSSQTHEWRVVV